MPGAVLGVGPMPEPALRYQPPLAALASTAPDLPELFLALRIPLSSPRDKNGARSAARSW